MKKIVRILFDFILKIPYLPQVGLWLVEKVPALRTIILRLSGASAIVVENGVFKFYSNSQYAYFDVSSSQSKEYFSVQAQNIYKNLLKQTTSKESSK